MNKAKVTIICSLTIIATILTAIAIFRTDIKEDDTKLETSIAEEEILDDCTDEYESTAKVNTQEEKTSPNCSLITKTYYKKCEHTKCEYDNLPQNLVNLTKDEIQEKYKDYEIESFASNEVILYQEKNGECGEHYIVKDKDGMVVIYRILEDGTEEELEMTGITTEYLTQTDKINMENGIRVNGRQELNQLIEDFE
jgi:hypothetical protein